MQTAPKVSSMIMEWEAYVETTKSNYNKEFPEFWEHKLQPVNYFAPMNTWIYYPANRTLTLGEALGFSASGSS